MSPEMNQFKKLLQSHGHFVTKPRLRLFLVLQEQTELTIKQLVSLLDQHDQATVYRNIIVFEELGIIHRLRLGWNSKLELTDLFHSHHHHATCDKCGKVIALSEDPETEQTIHDLAQRNNFKLTGHSLEISGLCLACQNILS